MEKSSDSGVAIKNSEYEVEVEREVNVQAVPCVVL